MGWGRIFFRELNLLPFSLPEGFWREEKHNENGRDNANFPFQDFRKTLNIRVDAKGGGLVAFGVRQVSDFSEAFLIGSGLPSAPIKERGQQDRF